MLPGADDPTRARLASGVVMPGDFQIKTGAYTYECPLCKHRHSYDETLEPMCTGPLWTDDHEPTMMVRK